MSKRLFMYIGGPGIGNQLFQYAALLSLSIQKNFDIFIIKRNRYYLKNFKIKDSNHDDKYNFQFKKYWDEKSQKYDETFFDLDSEDVLINGYFQNINYFIKNEKLIRDIFSFDNNIIKHNKKKLEQFRISSDTRFVAVHIRLPDISTESVDTFQYSFPTQNFINESMNKFNLKNDVFVIFSNDVNRCKEIYELKNKNVIYVSENEINDLCALSLCDDYILSPSTFGWWGCFLNPDINKKIIMMSPWYNINTSYNKLNEEIDLYFKNAIIYDSSNFKIILIAPGFTELPPKGWGAVESIVCDYYENLKSRHIDVHIVNNSNTNTIIQECNELNPDVIHIMYDDYISVLPSLNCKNVIYTSHYAYITNKNFISNNQQYFNNIFLNVIKNQNCVINSISEEIKNIYIKNGFNSKINIVHNGARDDKFVFKKVPDYPHKSIYVAKIEYRKCQYKYQQISNIDFAGNYANSQFNVQNSNYLGEWSKETLYNNLTNYSNLILLSEGEADPLVVKEALLAGLGVVLSECSSANLDLDKKFITVIPDDKLNNISFVSEQIEKNKIISNESREEIRKYALEKFSWSKIIDTYLLKIKEDFNL